MRPGRQEGVRALSSFRIFINYRRDDSRPYARLLHDALAARWSESGQIFWDLDTIEAGRDFADAIYRAVGRCDVLIALIGKSWLTTTDSEGHRRLDNADDYVRLEIEAGLARDVRVIPALVGGATMAKRNELPESLASVARLNAVELTDRHWDYDVEQLVRTLERVEQERLSLEEAERVRTGEHPAAIQRSAPAKERTPRLPAPRGRKAPNTTERQEHDGQGRFSSRVPGRSRRWLVAAVSLVAVIAAGAGYLLLRDRGGGGEHAMSQDAIESELLLAHIPESIGKKCHSGPNANPDVFLRSVVCSAEQGISVAYSRAHAGKAMRDHFLEQTDKEGISFPTHQPCRSATAAAGEWVREGLAGHREQRSRIAQGRVLCYEKGGRAWIVWTDTPTKIYAVASRPDSDRSRLYAWWMERAGPGRQLGHSVDHEPGPFPDAIDEELLLAHLPKSDREHCERADVREAQVFLRTVSCPQGDTDYRVEYSYAHSGTALRAYFENRATAQGTELPSGQRCRNERTAAGFWMGLGSDKRETPSRNADGALLCYVEGTDASLEWTDMSTLIFAQASRRSSERQDLYHWWSTKSGPVQTGYGGERNHSKESPSGGEMGHSA